MVELGILYVIVAILTACLAYLDNKLEKAESKRDDYENLYNVSQSEYIRIREVNSLMHSEALQLTLELRDIRNISFNRGALLDEKNDVIRALDITITEYDIQAQELISIIDMLAEAEVAALYPKEVNE
jgi:hypothetical protein